MFNVCGGCGQYRADKTISADGRLAICPECGHAHPFLRQPLFLVTGASGAGKSSVCQHLLGQVDQIVLLDADLLWRPEFDQPETHYRDLMELWLRLCKNIGQSGRPVALFGAGTGVPENMEPCIERRYLGQLHYLALTCDEAVLAKRLRSRPAWRNSADERFLREHLHFNAWFRQQSDGDDPRISCLDTTQLSVEETATQVLAWLRERLAADPVSRWPVSETA